MQYRYYKPEDYSMLTQWWESWSWGAFPEAALPATGIIISNEGVDVAAAFLYKTDSCVCWAENYISSKEAPRNLRRGAIEFLIKRMMVEAKEQGFAIMMSSVQHSGLIKKLIEAGCEEEYETGMSNLMKVL